MSLSADKKLMIVVVGLAGISTLAYFFWPKAAEAALPPASGGGAKKSTSSQTDAGVQYEFAPGVFDILLKVSESTSIFLGPGLYDAVSRQPTASVHVGGGQATITGRGKGRAQVDIVRRSDNTVMQLAVDII